MKQSKIRQRSLRNTQETLDKLPKQGCETLEKVLKEILGDRISIPATQTIKEAV